MGKLWKRLLKLIVIIIVIIAVIAAFPGGAAWLSSFFAAGSPIAGFVAGLANLPWYVPVLAGLGVSALIAPEETKAVIDRIGDVAGHVGEVAGDVIGKTTSSAFSSLGGVLIAGLLAWRLITRKDDDSSNERSTSEPK